MDTLTLVFSDIATDDRVITYTLTPIISKKGGWCVSKSDTGLKDVEMNTILEFLTMEDDIYNPHKIALKTPTQTYKFDFQSVLTHYRKREKMLIAEYGVCSCSDDDCDCDSDISNKYHWMEDNFFFRKTGLMGIINSFKEKAIAVYTEDMLKGKECPVSLEPLKIGETFQLPCEHYISRNTYGKLVEKKCPLCRHEIMWSGITFL